MNPLLKLMSIHSRVHLIVKNYNSLNVNFSLSNKANLLAIYSKKLIIPLTGLLILFLLPKHSYDSIK